MTHPLENITPNLEDPQTCTIWYNVSYHTRDLENGGILAVHPQKPNSHHSLTSIILKYDSEKQIAIPELPSDVNPAPRNTQVIAEIERYNNQKSRLQQH